MSKATTIPSNNNITIVGTLIDATIRDGNTKDGRPYRSGVANIRVNQHYNGKDEVSEVPVNFIAMKFKKDGTSNPAYENLNQFNTIFKSAQNTALSDATRIKINMGSVQENMYVSKNNPESVISNFKVSSNFFNEVKGTAASTDCATFSVDIFVMAIERELNKSGEETGRLKIRGGVVQYGNKLDVLDFYVEEPTCLDYMERNYNVNETYNVRGRIRYTTETVEYKSDSMWGEDIPQSSTVVKRELIICKGDDEPRDEELAYAPEDIKILAQDRINHKEQLKIDARNSAKKVTTQKASASSDYGWEE